MTSHSKTLRIVLQGELVSLNDYISAERKNRFLAAKIKKEMNEIVCYEAMSQVGRNFKAIDVPVFIEYHWHCKNRKKDKSNVAFAKKFIEDGLQDAGVLMQDNWNAIDGFSDHFYVDRENPHIDVIIKYNQ